MKYIIRFEGTGEYLSDPKITADGIDVTSSDDRKDAHVFANLQAAYHVSRPFEDAYLVPLSRK